MYPLATLIAFVGPTDPFLPTPIADLDTPGPIISFIRSRTIGKIVLLTTPQTWNRAQTLKKAIEAESGIHPNQGLGRCSIVTIQGMHLQQLVSCYDKISEWLQAADGFAAVRPPHMFLIDNAGANIEAAWLALGLSGRIKGTMWTQRNGQAQALETLTALKAGLVPFERVRLEQPNPSSGELCEAPEPFLDDVLTELSLCGNHPLYQRAIDTACMLAKHNIPLIILGETGTGKDRFSQLIHHMSPRTRTGKLITINCATLPENLAESILFGHTKGAFTGASQAQQGKFAHADNGTLFLDEITELTPKIQAKLLRVIEDGMITPLGASEPIKVDVRIIAATNKDLNEEVRCGSFREDLYYRLRVGELRLPALRDRRSDIPHIALAILERINKAFKTPKRLNQDSLELLLIQSWPGNIRDLQNVIERAALLSSKSILEPRDLNLLPWSDRNDNNFSLPPLGEGFSLESHLSNIRQRIIDTALRQSSGRQSEAARLLGISPQAVHRYVKEKMLAQRN